MADIQTEAIYSLRVQAKSDGVAETTQQVRELTDATQELSGQQQRVAGYIQEAENAYAGFKSALDPMIEQEQRINQQLQQSGELYTKGVIDVKQYSQAVTQGLRDLSQAYQKAADDVESMSKNLDSYSKNTDDAAEATLKWSDVLGLAKTALGALGVGLSIGAIVNFVKGVYEMTAALDGQSKVIGVGVEALQAYRAAATLVGNDVGVVDSTLRQFVRSMGQASASAGADRKIFEQFGVTLKDLAGSPESVIPKVAAGLMSITSEGERAEAMATLFGRSGQEVVQMLQQWADPSIVQKMKEMGLVIDEELVQRASQADAEWKTFWLHFKVGVADSIDWLIQLNQWQERVRRGQIAATDEQIERLRKLGVINEQELKRLRDIEAAQAHGRGLPLLSPETSATFTGREGVTIGGTRLPPVSELEKYQDSIRVLTEQAQQGGEELAAFNAVIEAARKLAEPAGASVRGYADAVELLGPELAKAVDLHARLNYQLTESRKKTEEAAKEQEKASLAWQKTLQALEQYKAAIGILAQQRLVDADLKTYQNITEELRKQVIATIERKTQEGVAQEVRKANFDAYMAQLEKEVALVGETRQQMEVRFAVEKAITLAKAANAKISEEELATIKEIVTGLVQSRQEADKQLDLTKDIQREWENVARSVQRSFSDTFVRIFEGGRDAFKNLGSDILNIFKRLLADMIAAALLQPVIIPIVGAMQGILGGVGGALGGGGMGAGGLLSAGASLFGGGGGFSGLGFGALGGLGGGFTGGYSPLGVFLNTPLWGTGGLLGGSGLPSALSLGGLAGGALTGLGLGSLTGMIGGNTTGGSIGGAIGGAIGSAILPGIGTMIGSLLGGLVGGLFKGGKPSDMRSVATFGTDYGFSVAAQSAHETSQQTLTAAQQAAAVISESMQKLTEAGLTFTQRLNNIWIGSRDQSTFQLDGGPRVGVGTVGDPADLAKDTLAALLKTATSTDENVQQVLKLYQSKGLTAENLEQFLSDIDFASSLKDLSLISEETSQWAQAVQAVNDQFSAVIERAKSLGLEIDGVMKAQADALAYIQTQFTASYTQQLQAIGGQFVVVDRYTAALNQINAVMAQATKEATQLGFSLTEISAAAAAATAAVEAAQKAEADAQAAADKAAKAAERKAAAERRAAEEQRKNIQIINEAIRAASEASRDAERLVSSWTDAQKSLEDARRALFITDPAQSPLARYQAAQTEFGRLRDLAMGGDPQAARELAQFASTFLQTSLSYNAATSAYSKDFALVQQVLEAAGIKAGEYRTQAQDQLDAINNAVELLDAIEEMIRGGTKVAADQLAVAQETLQWMKGLPGSTEAQGTAYTNAQDVIAKLSPGSSPSGNVSSGQLGRVLTELDRHVRSLRDETRQGNWQRRHGAA